MILMDEKKNLEKYHQCIFIEMILKKE